MSISLKNKLKERRLELQISLDELAKRANTSKSYLWELENRDTRKPSAEKLTAIAQALDVTTDYLLDDNAGFDDGHMKEAFFRKFNRLEDSDKKRIEDMINAWGRKK